MANLANEQAHREYGTLFDAVSGVLFRHDPIGINFDTNTDEYDPEARTILPRLSSCHSETDVLLVVTDEFHRWFGDDIRQEMVDYLPIAVDIWRLRSERSGCR